jgi:hypothetical protein
VQDGEKPKKRDTFDELGFESSAFEALEKDFQEVGCLWQVSGSPSYSGSKRVGWG